MRAPLFAATPFLSIVLVLTACSSDPVTGTTSFRSPQMRAEFQSDTIQEDAQRVLKEEMVKTGAKAGRGLEYVFEFPAQTEYTPDEIASALKTWHQKITSIADSNGIPIAANERIEIRLVYLSSDSDIDSNAAISIRPLPAGAKLFLDTPVSDVPTNEDGSVKLNSRGRFEIPLTFSFIQSTPRICYHTEFRGSIKYFYYDTKTQRKNGVTPKNMEEWKVFVETGALPAPAK